MPNAARYPPASFGLPVGKDWGDWLTAPPRVVIHTTETAGFPGYDDGRIAPHFTWKPELNEWRQHLNVGRKAGALARPKALETNGMAAIQIEIVAYSDRLVADAHPARLWVGDLTDTHLTDLAVWLRWCRDEWGVKLQWRDKPHTDSRCFGSTSPCRMTWEEWEVFDGVCDHAQVPTNRHWDAGALDTARLMEIANLDAERWKKPGDPILTAADARRVIRYQGTLDPALVMDLHTTAVVLDLDMQHDIRLRNLEKQ